MDELFRLRQRRDQIGAQLAGGAPNPNAQNLQRELAAVNARIDQLQANQNNQNGMRLGAAGGANPAGGAAGGGNPAGGDAAGGGPDPGAVAEAMGYLMAAKNIIEMIVAMFKMTTFNNAIVQLAKNLAGKDLAQQGKALTEAGMAIEIKGNSSVSQQLRLADAQLATFNSMAETNTKYWEEASKQNFVKGPGQSADLAKV